MYKLIICDDDEIILEGLSTVIDWEGMDVLLAGTASDGQEALELIEKQKPDILVTDIVMPFCNGFEIIEKAKECNLGIVILVISGYDEFSYAKEAIRMGVQDYVSKPIDIQEMERQIRRAVEKCRELRIQKHQEINKFIQKMCFYYVDPAVVFQQCDLVGLPIRGYYVVLLLWLDDEHEKEEAFFERVMEIVRRRGGYSFIQEKRQMGLCICGRQEKAVKEDREFIIKEARSLLREREDTLSVTIASGRIYRGITHLSQSLQDARAALGMKFIKGNDQDIFYDEKKDEGSVFWSGDEIFDINFIGCVKACNKGLIHEKVEKLYDILKKSSGESYLFTQFTLCNLYMNISKSIKESGIDALPDSTMESYRNIILCNNLQTSVECFENSLYGICDRIIEQKQGKHVHLVEAAKEYIQEHYQQTDLLIEDVADFVFMSKSYFSTIFKSVEGISFTDYLIQVRMEKAKERILNTEERMGDIALNVGYDNPTYFSVAFKKYTGKSPTEYKNEIQRQGN